VKKSAADELRELLGAAVEDGLARLCGGPPAKPPGVLSPSGLYDPCERRVVYTALGVEGEGPSPHLRHVTAAHAAVLRALAAALGPAVVWSDDREPRRSLPPVRLPGVPVPVAATPDLVVRLASGGLGVVEVKTTEFEARLLEPDAGYWEQAVVYGLVLNALAAGRAGRPAEGLGDLMGGGPCRAAALVVADRDDVHRTACHVLDLGGAEARKTAERALERLARLGSAVSRALETGRLPPALPPGALECYDCAFRSVCRPAVAAVLREASADDPPEAVVRAYAGLQGLRARRREIEAEEARLRAEIFAYMQEAGAARIRFPDGGTARLVRRTEWRLAEGADAGTLARLFGAGVLDGRLSLARAPAEVRAMVEDLAARGLVREETRETLEVR
jgi:hypothetical protein